MVELATLKFLDAKDDLLLTGLLGTGKSHVANALLAVQRGYKVLYREAHQLIEDLAESQEQDEIRKCHRTLAQ